MRVPLSWLRDYVAFDLAPRDLAEKLTMRGMEVTAIETAGADWTDVVVGRVVELARHPNADTLWLTSVDVGDGDPLDIVCGAQNLEVGQLVPAARVGAILPGERRIERSKIRGMVSNGMLCSAVELGLGADAEGIHILGHGDEIAPGTPLADLVGETVLDVDVKPNRGDALSLVGLAREIAAFTGAELRFPPVGVAEVDDPVGAHVSVRIEEPELNPRFIARWFGGVANGASPEWMQRRLVAAGMRPISAVVDVTNYVMHELGQPMHAYHADAVPGGRIVVRRARAGETLVTIDHVQRRLDEGMLVIADEERAIGLAGIMGGASTEVSAETTSVILESAIFDGPTIRNTARRLGLRSEASMRHEKGIGHDLPRLAADRAAALIAEITGAWVASGIVDNDPAPREWSRIEASVDRMSRLLGIDVSAASVGALIEPLGFEVEDAGETVVVGVPPHRLDVTSDADVAEEVARAHGYERIEGRLPRATLPPFRPDPSEPRHRVRRVLAGLGLDEMVGHALIGPDDLRRTRLDPGAADLIRLFNPLSEDHAILRPSMAPSLLVGLAENARWRQADVRLFEVGKVYWYRPDVLTPRDRRADTAGTGRYESWELGLAMAGDAAPAFSGEPARPADVADLKGVIDALHDALGAPLPTYRSEPAEARHAHRHPGRTGLICDAAGRPYGSVGEVHPAVVEAWGLSGRPVDAAIDLGRLLDLVPVERRSRPIAAAQPVDRDLAVVVTDATPVGEVLRVTRLSAGPMLIGLRMFDVYRGEQIGPGRVSYALALRFQPEEPGKAKAIEKALDKVRGSLRHHLGAEIR
ncbi:MAG: phenylalanine--tRNA ligase subunit beta [Chloroflexota bacterium]|nr:phenylalanine--tRNA ligase subunit beta [Chloroflexota bacterium]